MAVNQYVRNDLVLATVGVDSNKSLELFSSCYCSLDYVSLIDVNADTSDHGYCFKFRKLAVFGHGQCETL